jgi:hypothetical protein
MGRHVEHGAIQWERAIADYISSLLSLQAIYITQPPSTSYTLKMVNALYSEMFEQLQCEAWLHHTSQNYTLDTSCEHLMMRISDFLIYHDVNKN